MSMHIHCHSLNVGVIEKPKKPKNRQILGRLYTQDPRSHVNPVACRIPQGS